MATRARRAHFDRPRGGQTHILCSAASSAALRCVRAEFGALACHPVISRYSAGALRLEGTAVRAVRLTGWDLACGPTDVPFIDGHGCPRAAAVDSHGLVTLRD